MLASKINATSALENAETSAIGRRLSALGFGGTEYASADEVANAIQQQQDTGPILAHNEALQRNYASVYFIKEHLALRAWEAVERHGARSVTTTRKHCGLHLVRAASSQLPSVVISKAMSLTKLES